MSYTVNGSEGREDTRATQIDGRYSLNQASNTSEPDGRAIPQAARADGSILNAGINIRGVADHETNHFGQSQNSHSSKAPQFNVNAPKFEPGKPKASSVFSFLGNQQAHKVVECESSSLPSSDRGTQALNGASKPSKWNVEAPAFMPNAPFTAAIPSREFSFSALRPSFRPDAPAFKPSDSSNASDPGSTSGQNAVLPRKKIFGDIKFSEAIKSSKSKAIPITKPSEEKASKSGSDENMDGQEDESGRITQADGRQKRLRYVDFDLHLHIPAFPLAVLPEGVPRLDFA